MSYICNKMSKKTFYIVLLLASISLVGIIFTQMFWVKNAISLRQNQFDHRVSIALKSVVNRLLLNKIDSSRKEVSNCRNACGLMYNEEIIKKINPLLLDSLLKEELINLDIKIKYEYGIIQLQENKLIMGNGNLYTQELLKTNHTTSLTCLMTNDCFVLCIYFPKETNYIYSKMVLWLVLSILFITIIILSFSLTVYSYIKQKKLSAIKSDFVNNMTHELKTPISTISLSSEMLLQKEVIDNPDKIIKYAKIIYDENFRLKTQVEQVLQAAMIDKSKLQLHKSTIDIHKLIEENIDKINTIIKNRNGSITFKPEAKNSIVIADKVLMSTVISNLLDNACKYSNNEPQITIITFNLNDKIEISIEDKGIGINKEHIKVIFKEFYRVSTGNIHDVKGFGLGLYFVKNIIEAHNGSVKVISEINCGSKFIISLPFIKNEKNQ